MNLGQLTSKAKSLIDKRGGTDSVKQDAGELKGIASGSGSIADKAKAAAAAIKDPGADASPERPGTDASRRPVAGELPNEQRATRRRAGRWRRR